MPDASAASKEPWKPFHNSKPWKIETYRTVPPKLRPAPQPYLAWLWNPAVGPKPPASAFKTLDMAGKR